MVVEGEEREWSEQIFQLTLSFDNWINNNAIFQVGNIESHSGKENESKKNLIWEYFEEMPLRHLKAVST